MKKIIDFNEHVEKMKQISITKKEKDIIIKGYHGIIHIFLDVQSRKEKNFFLKNIVRNILRKTKRSNGDIIEISEEDGKSDFIWYLKSVAFKMTEERAESLWDEIKLDLIKRSNFTYFVIIGNCKDPTSNFTAIGSVIYSIRNQ